MAAQPRALPAAGAPQRGRRVSSETAAGGRASEGAGPAPAAPPAVGVRGTAAGEGPGRGVEDLSLHKSRFVFAFFTTAIFSPSVTAPVRNSRAERGCASPSRW